MGVVDFEGGGVEFFECGGDAGAPGALAVAGVDEEGSGGCGEDVADGFCEVEGFWLLGGWVLLSLFVFFGFVGAVRWWSCVL